MTDKLTTLKASIKRRTTARDKTDSAIDKLKNNKELDDKQQKELSKLEEKLITQNSGIEDAELELMEYEETLEEPIVIREDDSMVEVDYKEPSAEESKQLRGMTASVLAVDESPFIDPEDGQFEDDQEPSMLAPTELINDYNVILGLAVATFPAIDSIVWPSKIDTHDVVNSVEILAYVYQIDAILSHNIITDKCLDITQLGANDAIIYIRSKLSEQTTIVDDSIMVTETEIIDRTPFDEWFTKYGNKLMREGASIATLAAKFIYHFNFDAKPRQELINFHRNDDYIDALWKIYVKYQ